MTVGPGHFAILSALILAIGLGGVMTRRSATSVLASLGVAMLAPVIAAAGFAQTQQPATAYGASTGSALALILTCALAAHLLVSLGVLVLLNRRRHTLDLDEAEHLMG